MRRIRIVVAYDGTNYCGWQIQPNGITIEEILNRQISKLTGEDIRIIGASRTDSGVHALGNVAVFDTESRIPGDRFAYALNQKMTEDIYIVEKGDTLAKISKKVYGDSGHVDAICRMNGLSDGNLIFIGQKLILP